jgi:hypothetical protein
MLFHPNRALSGAGAAGRCKVLLQANGVVID